MTRGQVVLAVDIGTSATKVLAIDESYAVVAKEERAHPLQGHGDRAEHDPEVVLGAVINAVSCCVKSCADRGAGFAGLSFSGAMHTLLALDGAGAPLTPGVSWADLRASAQAQRIKRASPDLHPLTGTPVHPMSPLVKLAWFAEQRPELTPGAWCGLKDFVLFWCTDRLVTDLSTASATGLLQASTMDWLPDALLAAGVSARSLPDLVPPTQILALCADAAEVLGLPAGLPVVAGGGDGPLANLGVGAVRPGTAALSVGTSAALRVARAGPGIDELHRVFCYYLADGIWVTGGAVSNGGIVAQWAADVLGDGGIGELMAEAAQAPPGADGLLALPYLLGERAPWWDPAPRGALLGLRLDHTRGCVARAFVEGAAQQIALVRDAVLASGARIDEIRATGGTLRAPLWTGTLAAALGAPLHLTDDTGSAFGAALLGWYALGHLSSLDLATTMVSPDRIVEPDPAVATVLTANRPRIARAYDLLRELAPAPEAVPARAGSPHP